MDNIRQAIERAKASPVPASRAAPEPARSQTREVFGDSLGGRNRGYDAELDPALLQSHRIVAYDGKDVRSRPFDMLRTEILQSMDIKGWKTLAVTSPTPSCGKTFTAVNLALSMSRQTQRQVLLADLDLRRPQVSNCLGIKCKEGGLSGVVEGRIELQDAIVNARIGDSRLEILPTAPAANSSDVVGSAGLGALLERITRQHSQSRIVILDLPPVLAGHDVISTLPYVDCVLLVGAVGTTKASEIKECNKYLEGADVVRFVLNKAAETARPYLYY
jgi:protein-tyrosine kinase